MEGSSNLGKRLITGSFFVLVITILTSIISYFNRLFYAHVLSIEMYGLFYAGLGLVNTIWTYSDLGFGYSTTLLLPKYLKTNKHLLSWNVYKYNQIIQVVFSITASIILITYAPFIAARYFKYPGSENIIYVLSIYLVANSLLSSLIQFYIGAQKELYYSSIILIRAVFVILFSVLFWFIGKSEVVFYTLSWAIGYLITAAIFLFLIKSKFSYLSKQKLYTDYSLLKKMAKYALPAIIATIIGSLLTSGDIFLLTLFKGVAEVGKYNVIFPLASISGIILSPLNNLFLPLISDLMEGEKDKARMVIEKLLIFIPYVVLYFSLFLFIYPSTPVKLFFGERWSMQTGNLLGYLALGYVISSMVNLFGIISLGIGRAKEKLRVTALVVVLGVPINAVLIWYFGVAGSVATYIIVSMFFCVFFYKITRSVLPIRIPVKLYAKFFAGSLLFYLFFRLVNNSPKDITEYIFIGGVYTILYMIFGHILNIYDKSIINVLFKNNHPK